MNYDSKAVLIQKYVTEICNEDLNDVELLAVTTTILASVLSLFIIEHPEFREDEFWSRFSDKLKGIVEKMKKNIKEK